MKYDCLQNFKAFNNIPTDLRVASAVAMFGLILRQSKFINNVTFDNIGPIIAGSLNSSDYLQNEFAGLVEKAKKIYLVKKKKRGLSAKLFN